MDNYPPPRNEAVTVSPPKNHPRNPTLDHLNQVREREEAPSGPYVAPPSAPPLQQPSALPPAPPLPRPSALPLPQPSPPPSYDSLYRNGVVTIPKSLYSRWRDRSNSNPREIPNTQRAQRIRSTVFFVLFVLFSVTILAIFITEMNKKFTQFENKGKTQTKPPLTATIGKNAIIISAN